MRFIALLFLYIYAATSVEPDRHGVQDEVREQHTYHKCIHDELESWRRKLGIKDVVVNVHPNMVEVDPEPKKRHILEVSQGFPTYQPLRIYVADEHLASDPYTCYAAGQTIQVQSLTQQTVMPYTCTQNDVLTQTKKDYLLSNLLTASLNWLQSALNVIRPPGNLAINTASCTSTPLDVPVASTYISPGVDADFVIFVTSRPIMGGGTLAFASSCIFDNLGRPIAGHANFNTSNLVGVANDLPRQSGVATHEISHALGFSSSRWQSGTFIKFTGGKDSSGNYLYYKIPSTSTFISVNPSTNAHNTIITPTVVATVQQHFGCSTLTGADLEDGGSSGTAGSHWEKRVFMNEYMTGSEVNWPVLSNLTLSLFADTGWYTVNYGVTETLLWGKDAGCNFATGDCKIWTNIMTNKPGFCSAPSQSVSCNYDRRGYGICNIIDSISNIPSYFQHYGSPTTGGQSLLADYCGYVGQEGITTWCNIGATSIQQASDYTNLLGTSDYGEVFTIGSRCMLSTLSRINTPIELESFTDILIPAIQASRCYNTTCVGPNDMRIQVNGVWYPCDGQDIKVIGYGGVLTCPPGSELCSNAAQDYTWPVLASISPTSGGPATVITLTGGNFNSELYNYTVIMEVECSNVKVIDNNTITATIPGGDHFVSLADLAIFKTKKHVIVKDSRGYTAFQLNAFTIEVEFDAVYLKNLFNWMGQNPLWALLIWVIILLPFFCCCCIIYKCCCNKPKKPKRAAHNEYTHDREYYDDDYEVDDYYDVNMHAHSGSKGGSTHVHAHAHVSKHAHSDKHKNKHGDKHGHAKHGHGDKHGHGHSKHGHSGNQDDDYSYEKAV